MKSSIVRVISFLSLAAIPVALAAAQADSPALAQQKEALGKLLDQAVEEMFKPGEPDPNWNKDGVDLEQLAKVKPNQVLLEVDKDGDRSISLYSDHPIAEFIPPEWVLLAEVGSESLPTDADASIEISKLDESYYVASRSHNERVGAASCSNIPSWARLYHVKGANNPDMTPEVAEFIFREMMERGKPYTVCVRHDVVGVGYGTRYFLKDGRSLPFFDEKSGVIMIVPLRPTVELLSGK